METVISRDGTRIACECQGTGPPLVLVHGSGVANPVAWPAFAMLAKHFTLYAMDRRGRRKSGDAPAYAVEREFEDVAVVADAVAATAGEPAALLGHSYGGLCALEATLLTGNVRKLILYEAAIYPPGTRIYREGFIDRLLALLDAGHRDRVVTEFYGTEISPEEIEQLKASPAWPERMAAAHTLPREMQTEASYRFDPERFKALQIPTLLLVGGNSARRHKDSAEMIHQALPRSRIAVLPGQQHVAMYADPELFAREVVTFLNETA